MDPLTQLLVRMAIWIRRPPSRQFLMVASVAVVLALALATIEWLGYWPEQLTAHRVPRRLILP